MAYTYYREYFFSGFQSNNPGTPLPADAVDNEFINIETAVNNIAAGLTGVTAGAVRRFSEGTAAPTTGTWALGDIVWSTAPAAGGYIGWVCTAAGTPGTWKTFGAISA